MPRRSSAARDIDVREALDAYVEQHQLWLDFGRGLASRGRWNAAQVDEFKRLLHAAEAKQRHVIELVQSAALR